ncbi:MAG TPA: hypothetical protein VFF06_30965 [Polyangia bacterium]|nr:hypothetical protein [Polyangia bacterium]
MSVVLSTVFTHATSFAEAFAPEKIVDALERSGAGGVVLDAGLDAARFEALARELAMRPALPVIALESPCPRSVESNAMLASIDREESEVAARAAEATLERAGELRARFVIVRLGAVRSVERDWTFAREKFLRGQLDEELARRLFEAREDSADRTLDAARRALDRLARAAERAGVVLCVKNGRRYIDLPLTRELDVLLADCAGAPVAPLCDVPAAHLQDVMGFQPLALTLAAFGERAPLVYAGDACGPLGALAPGRGEIDLPSAMAKIAKDAQLAFSPWTGLTVEEVVEATPLIDRLRA